MEIDLLNVKVTFQKNSVVSDSIGNRKNVWEDYYTCHATVSGEGGQEKAAFHRPFLQTGGGGDGGRLPHPFSRGNLQHRGCGSHEL